MKEKNQSRTKFTARNAIISIMKYVISIITAFSLRTFVFKYFGTEYSGLVSVFSNIITILSITELGIGSALIYKLYKPVAENDEQKIKTLLKYYKKVYGIIGLIILTLGLCLSPFLKFIVQEEVSINIYLIYAMFLINSVISYFMAHRRALIFASQKNYIENITLSISTIVIYPLQLVFILVLNNPYLYTACSILITILDLSMIYFVTNKRYKKIMSIKAPNIEENDKREIKKNAYALSFIKVASSVGQNVDSIIITSFLGLTIVAIYSNYLLIVTYLIAILNLFFSAIRASVGNFVATNTKEKSYELFKTIDFGFSWLIGFCSIALISLYQPFMAFWGQYADQNFILPIIIPILLSIYFFVDCNRGIVRIFKETAGHFWKDRFAPLISMVVNVGLSIALSFKFGLAGIVFATIVSILSAPVWLEVKILFNDVFQISQWHYWKDYIIKILVALIACGLTYFICSLISVVGFWGIIIKAIICLIVPNIVYLLAYFKTKAFANLKTYVLQLLVKKH